jgi:hypothetical protein
MSVRSVVLGSPLGEALGPDAMHFNLEMAAAKFAETFNPANKSI